MESDNRPLYPCRCEDDDELELIEDLIIGCPLRRDNGEENDNNCNNNSGNCSMPNFGNNVALAIVYSPDHAFDGMYEPAEGLMEGTMFKALNKPFMGKSIQGGRR